MTAQLASLHQVQAQLARYFDVLSANPVECVMIPGYWYNVSELTRFIADSEELYSTNLIQPIVQQFVSKLKPRAKAIWETRGCLQKMYDTLSDIQDTVIACGGDDFDESLFGVPQQQQLSSSIRREIIH